MYYNWWRPEEATLTPIPRKEMYENWTSVKSPETKTSPLHISLHIANFAYLPLTTATQNITSYNSLIIKYLLHYNHDCSSLKQRIITPFLLIPRIICWPFRLVLWHHEKVFTLELYCMYWIELNCMRHLPPTTVRMPYKMIPPSIGKCVFSLLIST